MDIDSKAESTNTIKGYKIPVSQKIVEQGSTVEGNGVGDVARLPPGAISAPERQGWSS